MKEFLALAFDPITCRAELNEFRDLLAASPELEERRDILPFFRERRHLSAFIGSYSPYVSRYDQLAYEYSLFGDFACDLVTGYSQARSYCFVEFEDARTDSIFVRRKGKSTPEWSSRFEHGFSQLVDWFWKLDDARPSAEFRHRFGPKQPYFIGMLVVGRAHDLADREQHRLDWRLARVVIDSKPVLCVTYDQLLADLDERLERYTRAA
jgi:hypothetical protein